MLDADTAKTFAPFIGTTVPFISAFVDSFLKPKLAEIAQKRKLDANVFEYSLGMKFQEYFVRSYEKHKYLTTIVLPRDTLLKDIYIPLTVTNTSNKGKIQINDYPSNLIPDYSRILLIDDAGMGKSTLLKYLFLSAMEANVGLPVFIELRKLRPAGDNKIDTIIDFIVEELQDDTEEIDRLMIKELIHRGDFIFFLDGYDEIGSAHVEAVTEHLQHFIEKSHRNSFVLSSRPDDALRSFVGFHEFEINPLKREEAYELLTRYDRTGEISKLLIAEIKKSYLQHISEFLTNPLMTSLLYRAFDFRQTIPARKDQFYNQVFEALFFEHDLTKGGSFTRDKECELNIDQFRSILRSLGFLTLKSGTIEYSRQELLTFIVDARSQCAGLDFNETSFLNDLLNAVPLFARDGDYYRWKHKAFQEYFAAMFIYNDSRAMQGPILRKLVQSKYLNVLRLYYDIDPIGFRNILIKDLIENYFVYRETTFHSPDLEKLTKEEMVWWQEITFGRELEIFLHHVSPPDDPEVHQELTIGWHTTSDGLIKTILEEKQNALTRSARSVHNTIDYDEFEQAASYLTNYVMGRAGSAILLNEDSAILQLENDRQHATTFVKYFEHKIMDENICRGVLEEILESEAKERSGDLLAGL